MRKLFLPLLLSFILLDAVDVLPEGCEGGNAEHFRQREAYKEKKKREAEVKAQEEAYNY